MIKLFFHFFLSRFIPFLLFTLHFVVTGCKNKDYKSNANDQRYNFQDKVKLVPEGELKLVLDSLSTPNVYSLQYHQDGFFQHNRPELSILNPFTNTLYLFDLESGGTYKKITLAQEGPDGVGKAQATYFLNSDTLLVQSMDGSFKINLLNSGAQKIGSIDLDPFADTLRESFSNSYVSFPSNMMFNKPAVYKGKLYFTGSMDDSWNNSNIDKSGLLIEYDINTRLKKYSFPYPKSYTNAIWTIYFRRAFKDFINDKEQFIFSFPADHNVYLTDMQGNLLRKAYGGSKNFGDISSFPYSMPHLHDRFKRDKYYAETPHYASIFYDPYRKLFYRLAYLPLKDYHPDDRLIKTATLIILNDNLEKIGEYQFPEKQITMGATCFVSKEGLNIQKLTDNEDEMVFVTYKVKMK